VRKGKVLARVGSDMFEADLAEAQARLEGAQAIHEKSEQLFKREHLPRQELIAATSALRAAEARLRQAELRLERSVIEAPISGVALNRELEPGEVVSPGAPITELYRVDRLKAVAGIPESDIAAFRVGGEATIEVDAFPGRTFEGRIHLVGPAAMGPSRTFPTEIAIDNRSGELRPGMIARVALVKRKLEGVIVLERPGRPVELLADSCRRLVGSERLQQARDVRTLGQPARGEDTERAIDALKTIRANCDALIEMNPDGVVEKALAVAISVEEREYQDIYPRFRDQALEQGDQKAADVYQRVVDSESQHADWFRHALDQFRAGMAAPALA